MRVLVTGHEGFVGRELLKSLEGHDILTLEATEDFYSWMQHDLSKALSSIDSELFVPLPIDIIFHVGALNNNQYLGSEIYLWNSTATYLIAHEMATKPHLKDCHLVYFSSRLAQWARDLQYKGGASPYSISKMMAEDYINELLPDRASILQPQNIWGDERGLFDGRASISVPFMLASHKLKYLFHNLSRDFVHVDDVVSAAIECGVNRYAGTFEVGTGKCTNAQQLRDAIEWKDYEMREPESSRFLAPEGVGACSEKWAPNWEPKVEVLPAMKALEREIHS